MVSHPVDTASHIPVEQLHSGGNAFDLSAVDGATAI